MAIATSTYISDSVKLLRDSLQTALTDPIASSRSGRERFVMTSYPQRGVKYPIITVKSMNIKHIQRLGFQSEATRVRADFEIRIWARNEKEKDELTEQVYNYLRDNQLTGTDLSGNGLNDFTLNSMVNVDEDGENAIKSKVIVVSYSIILT
jgi:hypothetical protein